MSVGRSTSALATICIALLALGAVGDIGGTNASYAQGERTGEATAPQTAPSKPVDFAGAPSESPPAAETPAPAQPLSKPAAEPSSSAPAEAPPVPLPQTPEQSTAVAAPLPPSSALVKPTTAVPHFFSKPVRSWAIQLQNPDPATIARTPYDLVTIDYSRDASARGAFTAEDVALMKKKPGGGERLLIAYMSIGEAEDYRYYWAKNGWKKKAKRPSWILKENPEWRHNYTVKFWNQGWKDIIYAKAGSYLDKIIDAGFDGVYLDKIDITDVLEDEAPKGTTAYDLMVEFVRGISEAARKRKPDFILIASNAEAALDDDDYRGLMHGIGKEDLFFNSRFNEDTGELVDGFANDAGSIKEQIRLLQKLIDDEKVVLAVEYLDTKPELINPTAQKLLALGYVPYFGPRDLARLSDRKIAAIGGPQALSLEVVARKAAACTGLEEAECRRNSSCVWMRGYLAAGVDVAAYCRSAPQSTAARRKAE